jgi:hypothetical protein
MIYVALTGISRMAMKELLSKRLRTVEIRSPNNFVALLSVKPGERIFITESSAPDIVPGSAGLIASVKAAQVITHRIVQSGQDYYEEREAQAARAQLQLVGAGRVRRVTSFEMGEPVMLEVDEVRYCDAR